MDINSFKDLVKTKIYLNGACSGRTREAIYLLLYSKLQLSDEQATVVLNALDEFYKVQSEVHSLDEGIETKDSRTIRFEKLASLSDKHILIPNEVKAVLGLYGWIEGR